MLASSSISSGSGLNTLGNALAEHLMLCQTSSPGTGTELSDTPTAANMAGSVVGSEAAFPQTLPLVVKPSAASTDKCVVVSSVKRVLLFQDSSPRDGSESVLELAPQLENVKQVLPVVDDPAPPPDPSVVASPGKTTTSKRRPLAPIADAPGKKKKNA